MATENINDILRRVQKLLAIASDDRANPAEAAAAAGMAERIMRKYQIDNADLIAVQLKDPDHLATADCVATAKTNGTAVKQVPPWANILSVAVAEFNDCGARILDVNGTTLLRFYGYTADVQVAKWMFDYLVATINRLANAYKNTSDYHINGRTVLTAYRRGVCNGMCSTIRRLTAEKKREEEEARQASVTGRSLVVIKEQVLLEKYGKGIFATVTVKHHQSSKTSNAYGNGVTDGRKVDVNRRGITNTPNSTLRLS